MKKLIQELPRPNQDTMKVLFSHLLRYTPVSPWLATSCTPVTNSHPPGDLLSVFGSLPEFWRSPPRT